MEWGWDKPETLVMWHGLARTGRDFDDAARAMSATYRVVCPDTLGRGRSQWAVDADTEYCFDFYSRTAVDLLDQLGVGKLRWLGTSMGGLLGTHLAAGSLAERITHLVINDIGPDIPEGAVERIATYVGNPPRFQTIAEMEQYLRTVYAPFGDNPDSFWQLMAETSYRRTDDGGVTAHYDPQIVNQFTMHAADLDVWPAYERIACPTLLLRGAVSDVLAADTAQAMTERGPKARLEVFEGVGHAPTLRTQRELELLNGFFAA